MSAPTWLVVVAGGDNLSTAMDEGLDSASPVDAAAHHMVFTEDGGVRRAVLLVHWSEQECGAFVNRLRPHANALFLNGVQDLRVE